MRALLAAVAFLPAPALAQAYQCGVPKSIEPVRPPRPDGPVRRVPIAGYTLAASWSPDYCKTSGETASMQCSRRNGRFGFVLHGLWPEARSGPPPQWCGTRLTPSPDILRRHLCMTPSAPLLAHEWAKHGSCMTGKPETYFKVGSILWRSIRWPDADHLSRQDKLTVGDFRRAFITLNPAWKPGYVGVGLSRAGWLREVRLCYGKDFTPKACGRQQFGPADSAGLKIWRGL
ncbi:MAG TPA: ribonuclease T [Novosphingobium sp.]|nr:ribonuclease T [Novosphingobium sp.]